MTTTGYPSKGCYTCRARRIGCDQARPSCGQCIRMNKTCTGYRNMIDLVFRGEKEPAERKLERRFARKEVEATKNADRRSLAHAVTNTVVLHTDVPQKALSEPWDQQALCFFMSDRSIVPRQLSIDKLSFATIVTPVCMDTCENSALMSILSSISLFSLSHVPGRESLAVDAQYHYSLAVSRLNKAIADPVASKKNDTLLCVLLFQLREIITMTDSSLVIWRQHIEGALAVCRMRGKPRNILERRLYAAIRDLLVMRRLRDHKLIPQDEIDTLWTRWPFDESSYHYDRLAERSLDIPNLRAKAYKLLRQPMNPSVALALQTISADAKRLDLRIIIWPDELPPSGFYSKLFTYKGPLPAHTQLSQIEIWPGAIDYYWDLDKAHMWNTYRMHRALILMVVINCAERLHSPAELRHNADYSNAVQVIRTMVDEVCASVPYILHSSRITRENASRVLLSAAHLRPTDVNFADSESRNLWDPTPSPSKSGRFSDAHVPVPLCNDRESRDCGDGKGHAWITLGGLPLISSLYIASTLICVPKKQRIWIRGRLRAIAESYSLDQAKVLENIVAQEEKQNMLDQGPSMGRMPTISDLAPLPWVEWGTEGEFEAKRGPTPIGIRQYLVPIQTNQIPSWGF